MMDVRVIFTDGTTELIMKLPVSYGKDTLYLQSDPGTHRAWNPDAALRKDAKGTRAEKLASRFMKL